MLHHFGIRKPLLPYHQHNRAQTETGLWARLEAGEDGALCTDAGMPGISDPGMELVAGCHARGIPVLAVPGPVALTTALALSGMPAGRFCFEGFLSTARKSRFEHLRQLRDERRAMVFYEAPHKLLATLRDMLDAFGDRQAALSREMTKLYEETLRGTLSSLLERFSQIPPRGEFVLIVEGAPPPPPVPAQDVLALARSYRAGGLSVRDAARRAAEETGTPRREIYEGLKKD